MQAKSENNLFDNFPSYYLHSFDGSGASLCSAGDTDNNNNNNSDFISEESCLYVGTKNSYIYMQSTSKLNNDLLKCKSEVSILPYLHTSESSIWDVDTVDSSVSYAYSDNNILQKKEVSVECAFSSSSLVHSHKDHCFSSSTACNFVSSNSNSDGFTSLQKKIVNDEKFENPHSGITTAEKVDFYVKKSKDINDRTKYKDSIKKNEKIHDKNNGKNIKVLDENQSTDGIATIRRCSILSSSSTSLSNISVEQDNPCFSSSSVGFVPFSCASSSLTTAANTSLDSSTKSNLCFLDNSTNSKYNLNHPCCTSFTSLSYQSDKKDNHCIYSNCHKKKNKEVEYNMALSIMNKPTRVEFGKLKCLIFDAPTNENLQLYIKEMLRYGVTDLVRTCEKTYDESVVEAAGIRVHQMLFPDGDQPPDTVINEWLLLVNEVTSIKGAIAVHCVAGLGRAPVLVAIAFIENGMDPLDAIMFIRERRKGAINRRQLQFLKNYKRRLSRRKFCPKGCVIM